VFFKEKWFVLSVHGGLSASGREASSTMGAAISTIAQLGLHGKWFPTDLYPVEICAADAALQR